MLEQLSNHESLRDLIVFLETHQKEHYRLELGHEPIVKTMLVSGQSKPSKTLLSTWWRKYAFDSTTIPLCLTTFPWAKLYKKKGGIKAHVFYDNRNISSNLFLSKHFIIKKTMVRHRQLSWNNLKHLYKPHWYEIYERQSH